MLIFCILIAVGTTLAFIFAFIEQRIETKENNYKYKIYQNYKSKYNVITRFTFVSEFEQFKNFCEKANISFIETIIPIPYFSIENKIKMKKENVLLLSIDNDMDVIELAFKKYSKNLKIEKEKYISTKADKILENINLGEISDVCNSSTKYRKRTQ